MMKFVKKILMPSRCLKCEYYKDRKCTLGKNCRTEYADCANFKVNKKRTDY